MFLLCSCSGIDPSASYVSYNIDPHVVNVASADITAFAASILPPGKATIWVRPAQNGSRWFAEAIEADLRRRGFAIAPSSGVRPYGAHELRYLIDQGDIGTTVRVSIDQIRAGRFYGLGSSGAIAPIGPLTALNL
ncbi:hypothetical protein AA105894_1656 [Asaia spathodeae NBRC 105894]|nr:hypothetical protein AA105894_1656 [Asaia spathodeae NBRC 105894]